jgi:hypothetical protein
VEIFISEHNFDPAAAATAWLSALDHRRRSDRSRGPDGSGPGQGSGIYGRRIIRHGLAVHLRYFIWNRYGAGPSTEYRTAHDKNNKRHYREDKGHSGSDRVGIS